MRLRDLHGTLIPQSLPSGAVLVRDTLGARLHHFLRTLASHRTPNMDKRPEQVQRLVATCVTQSGPGACVGVFRNGITLLRHGYGLATLETRRRMRPDTMLQIGSLSKHFTAMAVASLVADERLPLDRRVSEVLPGIVPDRPPINITDLIYHTSGIRDYLALSYLAGLGSAALKTRSDILALLRRQTGLNFAPGTAFRYSNSGYFLLALIVEAASGMAFEEYCTQRLFAPAGMSRTVFANDAALAASHRGFGYTSTTHGKFTRCLTASNMFGPGGLFTTIDDLGRWAACLASATAPLSKSLVALATSAGRLRNATPVPYAFGMHLWRHNGRRFMLHTGNFGGYMSSYIHCPVSGTTVAVLSNSDRLLATLATRVLDLYAPSRAAASGVVAETARPSTAADGLATTPMVGDLNDFPGRYYSQELMACYQLVRVGDVLVLRRPVPHYPSWPALCRVTFQLRFTRESSGRVTGFLLDTVLARGMSFVRTPHRPAVPERPTATLSCAGWRHTDERGEARGGLDVAVFPQYSGSDKE